MAAQGFNSLIHDYIGYLSGKNEIEFITSRISWTNKKPQSSYPFRDEINTITSENLIIYLPNNQQIAYPNMYFKKGNSYLIFGPNGVGKSTFIKLLLGINKNFEGNVLINNFKLMDYAYINKISYYSNDLNMIEGTIKDNIFLKNYDDVAHSKTPINKWGLSIDENIIFHQINLSNGQKQKVLILRALNKKSDVYIFDEPLSNLDRHSKEAFLRSINILKRSGKIILVISHEIPDYTFDKTYFLSGRYEK